MRNFLDYIFGCRHARVTWPQTRPDKVTKQPKTTVACLDCGREFDYDYLDPDPNKWDWRVA